MVCSRNEMQDFFTASVAVTWCDCLNVPLTLFCLKHPWTVFCLGTFSKARCWSVRVAWLQIYSFYYHHLCTEVTTIGHHYIKQTTRFKSILHVCRFLAIWFWRSLSVDELRGLIGGGVSILDNCGSYHEVFQATNRRRYQCHQLGWLELCG